MSQVHFREKSNRRYISHIISSQNFFPFKKYIIFQTVIVLNENVKAAEIVASLAACDETIITTEACNTAYFALAFFSHY